MNAWQDELLSALASASSEEEAFERLKCESAKLEFEYCAYGVRLPLPVTKPRIVIRNNYPQAWQVQYEANSYLAVDPTVRHASGSCLPLIWSEALFVDTRGFWEDARSHGLCYGWAQSSIDSSGVRGMLTLARSGQALTQAELASSGYKMAWLTQVAHLTMTKHLVRKMAPEMQASLSNREVTVLRWTAGGKTSGEISDILTISERTVNFHIGNAMQKLNANNKTAAAVKAALLGLL